MKKVILTGIQPTGTPHLGNYFGAMRPAISLASEHEAFYFIADYHSLNSVVDHEKLRQNTREIAAAFLALGLDTSRTVFYRQSDVPQIFETYAVLASFTPKGLLNRAHAYKAMVAKNMERTREENGEDQAPTNDAPDTSEYADAGVNMGLFNYPLLMAADILTMGADIVPVGRDQQQHLEIASDVARSANARLKAKVFTIPAPHVQEGTMEER